MQRRTAAKFGAGIVLGIVVLSVFIGMLPKHPINETNAKRIASGMAESDVETLLGKKGMSVKFRNEKILSDYCMIRMEVPATAGAQLKRWDRDGGEIEVLFDQEGRSIAAIFIEVEHVNDTLWKKIRRRLRL